MRRLDRFAFSSDFLSETGFQNAFTFVAVFVETLFENLTEYVLHLETYIDCSWYMPSPCGFYLNMCSMSVTWLNLSYQHFPTSRAHIPKNWARKKFQIEISESGLLTKKLTAKSTRLSHNKSHTLNLLVKSSLVEILKSYWGHLRSFDVIEAFNMTHIIWLTGICSFHNV